MEEIKEEIVNDDSKIKIIVVAILVILIGTFIMGCQLGEKRMQDSAIRYNAGEYYSDSTGKTHFRFISSKGITENVASETIKSEEK